MKIESPFIQLLLFCHGDLIDFEEENETAVWKISHSVRVKNAVVFYLIFLLYCKHANNNSNNKKDKEKRTHAQTNIKRNFGIFEREWSEAELIQALLYFLYNFTTQSL